MPVFAQVTVAVQSNEWTVQHDLPVMVYQDDTYLGISSTTNANGDVHFWLPAGSYRFMAEQFGQAFFTAPGETLTAPDRTWTYILVVGTVNGVAKQTINYTYDDLNRLNAADYASGAYFHSGYDAVGAWARIGWLRSLVIRFSCLAWSFETAQVRVVRRFYPDSSGINIDYTGRIPYNIFNCFFNQHIISIGGLPGRGSQQAAGPGEISA